MLMVLQLRNGHTSPGGAPSMNAETAATLLEDMRKARSYSCSMSSIRKAGNVAQGVEEAWAQSGGFDGKISGKRRPPNSTRL